MRLQKVNTRVSHIAQLRRQFEAEAKLTSDDGDAEPRSIAELQVRSSPSNLRRLR
jgi:hypothetical protein